MKRASTLCLLGLFCLLLSSCSKEGEYSSELIPVVIDGKFGYIDPTGQVMIAPQFDAASVFSNGLARVMKDGKWGFIDTKGAYAIEAKYVRATWFSEGYACVVKENGFPEFINEKGETIATMKDAESAGLVVEGLAPARMKDDKWGFVAPDGTVKIPATYEEVRFFSDGLAAVKDDKQNWGFIDKDGKVVVAPAYRRTQYFRNGLAAVQDAKDRWGYIDKTGKLVIEHKYENAQDFVGDLAFVSLEGKFGAIDKSGAMVIAPAYTVAAPFTNGLAAVRVGDSTGYIDEKGEMVITPRFPVALPFIGSVAIAGSNGKYGLIDSKGAYVVEPRYERFDLSYLQALNEGIMDIGEYFVVTTDYFDAKAAAEGVLKKTSAEAFLGVNGATTFADVRALHTNIADPQPEQVEVLIDRRRNVTSGLTIGSMRYTFASTVYENPGALLRSLSVECLVYGAGKREAFITALKKALQAKTGMTMTEGEGNRTVFSGGTWRIEIQGGSRVTTLAAFF